MWGTATNTSQDEFQTLILLVAVLSVPVMLLVKPLYLIKKMKKRVEKGKPAREGSN